MQKLTCTLEFKEGRPVAKECQPIRSGEGGQFETKEREFEIRYIQSVMVQNFNSLRLLKEHKTINIGDRFTATIENNIVTKIELL